MITVRYFAAARAAAGVETESVSVPDEGLNREELFAELARLHPEAVPGEPALARVLAQSTCLVDGVSMTAGHVVTDGQRADVLPPFAGG